MWLCRQHKVSKLVSLGGFRNERNDYDWEGFKLELDKTMFPWGTVYEVEVETVGLFFGHPLHLFCLGWPWF